MNAIQVIVDNVLENSDDKGKSVTLSHELVRHYVDQVQTYRGKVGFLVATLFRKGARALTPTSSRRIGELENLESKMNEAETFLENRLDTTT